jgi:colicin import membrane protein
VAQNRPAQVAAAKNYPAPSFDEASSRLWKCIVYSGAAHVAFVSALWLVPHLPMRASPSYPVYTVDLVGGEKLGGTNLGTERPPPRAKKVPARVKVEPPPPATPAKKEPAKSVVAKTEPRKKEEVAVTQAAKKEVPKKEETKTAQSPASMQEVVKPEKPKAEPKEQARPAEGVPDKVRQKLIEAALQRVRERAESEKRAEAAAQETRPREKEVMSAGPGEGTGAAVPGPGGLGGGIVKSFDFLVYRNQMLRVIRDRWTWVGRRSDLEVAVRFGIREDGQIMGLRIVRASGDPSYDDSVLRAVTKASPLAPPPENYRQEFTDVELTFRPKDLGG